jgi:hypothetical protein
MRFAALVSSLVAINAANASPTAPIPANTRDISTKYGKLLIHIMYSRKQKKKLVIDN